MEAIAIKIFVLFFTVMINNVYYDFFIMPKGVRVIFLDLVNFLIFLFAARSSSET